MEGPFGSGGTAPRHLADTHSLVDGIPIYVCKERVDIVSALRRGIVEKEGMLPHVHYEDRDKPCVFYNGSSRIR